MLSARYPPDAVGGYEWVAFDVANRLAARGHDLCVVAGRPEIPCEQMGEVPVRRVLLRVPGEPEDDGSLGLRFRAFRAYLRNYRAVREAISAFAPQVLYVWAGAQLTPAVIAACEEDGLPLVFHLEDAWLLRAREQTGGTSIVSGLATTFKRRFAVMPRMETDRWHAIYVSAALQNQYEDAGFSPGKAAVIHNGYDPEVPPRDWPADPPARYSLGYAGRIRPNKGLEQLLAALERCIADGRQDVRLRVVGKGEPAYEAELQERIRSGPLLEHVEWAGPMPRAQALKAYRAFDLLVVPSQWEEPFGLVAIEAMAAGVPVLATRRRGLKEIVDDSCG